MVFPQDVQQFISLHPTAYADDHPPAEPQVSIDDVRLLANSVPARKTNNLLKTTSGMVPSANIVRSPAALSGAMAPAMDMNNLMGSVMAMMTMMQQHQSPLQVNRKRSSPSIAEVSEPLDGNAPSASRMLALTTSPATGPHVDVVGQHCEVDALGGDNADDDIDAMLGDVGKQKGVKQQKLLTPLAGDDHGTPADADKPPKVSKATRAAMKVAPSHAKTTSTKKPPTKVAPRRAARTVASFSVSKPPPFGTKLPVMFNGCKIYRDATSFRVCPAPRESVYDRKFGFRGDEQAAWKSLMAFCKKPFIPKESRNYVLIKLPRAV